MPLLALPNELLLQIARCLLQYPHDCRCDCDCHRHHTSADLSSLSRANHHLHALLSNHLLATASTLHILFWAVAISRPDTVSLALKHGADPNCPLSSNAHVAITWRPYTTPVDLAICMRAHSVDAPSHALKLATLALLLSAAGTCTADELIQPTRHGDLDLLTVCLPHLAATTAPHAQSAPRTLLEIAARRGHVEAAKLAIAAGASVNSTGAHNDPEYYPLLWVCWRAPVAVLQVLLDAGADATWRARHGDSVVQNMRRRTVATVETEEKIALLVRYGAVDEGGYLPMSGGGKRRVAVLAEKEYRGWVPGSREHAVDWVAEWRKIGKEEGCGCLRGGINEPGTDE